MQTILPYMYGRDSLILDVFGPLAFAFWFALITRWREVRRTESWVPKLAAEIAAVHDDSFPAPFQYLAIKFVRALPLGLAIIGSAIFLNATITPHNFDQRHLFRESYWNLWESKAQTQCRMGAKKCESPSFLLIPGMQKSTDIGAIAAGSTRLESPEHD